MTTKLWRLAALAITMNVALIVTPGTGNAGVKAKLTYCAPFCQVDLGRCLDFCPA